MAVDEREPARWRRRSVSPVSARAAPCLEQRLGEVRGEGGGARRPRRSAAAASPWLRSAAASSAWASASSGVAATRVERWSRAAGQSASRGGARERARSGGPGSAGVALSACAEDGAGEARLAGGEPLVGGVGEDGGAELRRHRAVRVLGERGQHLRRGRVRAEGGERRGLAEPGRDAAAERSQTAASSRAWRGSAASGGLALVGVGDRGRRGGRTAAATSAAAIRRRMRRRVRLRRDGHDPARDPDARPWLLGGGAGRKARGWQVRGTTRSADRAAAMRAAGVEPVDWADAAAVDARRSGAARGDPRLAAAGRGGRPGAGAARRGAGRGAGAVGRISLDDRGLWRPAGRLGRRGGALAPVASAGGWRVAAEAAWRGDRAAGACCSGSRGSTGRGGASSTGSREGRRSGW